MTIVLGTAIICAAALLFAVLAMACRSHTPPALLHKDLTQTLSLLALMAMVAGGTGVLADGVNGPYTGTHLIMAGTVAVVTLAALAILKPWNRFAVTADTPPTDFEAPDAGRKAA